MKICIHCGLQNDIGTFACPHCGKSPPMINNKFFSFAPESLNRDNGFKDEFFEKLYAFEASNFWFISRNRLIIWAIGRYFRHIKNFIEIGCGTGYVIKGIRDAFPDIKISGSEILAKGLEYASSRVPDAYFFQMDARNMPFLEEFDVIGAFDVLEHIENDIDVLKQINKATKENGGIILTVPQHPFLWSWIDEISCHKRRYSAKELCNKVEQTGFKVLFISSFVTLLFPFMLISRLFEKMRKNYSISTCEEFKFGNYTNRIFENILDIERLFIEQGISFPFGGSLLLIAAKRMK